MRLRGVWRICLPRRGARSPELPVLLVFMAIICTDKFVMGKYCVPKITRILLYLTIGVVGLLSIACIVLQLFGIG